MILNWKESGGPKVVPPLKEGFGSQLIAVCARSLSGTVQSQFAPEGITCLIKFPLGK